MPTIMRATHYLTELTGIGPKLADKIRLTLAGKNDPNGEATALRIISEEPYRLIEVPGIGFKRADKIALNDIGVDEDAPERHEHGNREALAQDGCLTEREYHYKRRSLGLINPELEYEGVHQESGMVWLPEELQAEKTLAAWLRRNLDRGGARKDLTAEQRAIATRDDLNDDQAEAVRVALSGVRIMVLTGAAGTGKTRTLATIAKAALLEGKSTHVMAFAGKAAQRAAEAMRERGARVECSTIHRGLGHDGRDYTVDELEDDLIILDESSMIPNHLLAAVITRLPESSTLILTGDPNQLPPIGYGTPFADIISVGAARVDLQRNYRQANQQSIYQLAEAIKDRQRPPFDVHRHKGPGLTILTGLSDEDLDTESHQVVEQLKSLPLGDWQVLTWKNDMRAVLNQELQELINPYGEYVFAYPEWKLPHVNKDHRGRPTEQSVRKGDKVMVKRNDYEIGIFNGQTGIVVGTERVEGLNSVIISMEEDTVAVPLVFADELLVLGYAITTHKAQGSGWPHVLVFQPDNLAPMALPNRWWYTSITRAESHLYVFSQQAPGGFWQNVTYRELRNDSTLTQRLDTAVPA